MERESRITGCIHSGARGQIQKSSFLDGHGWPVLLFFFAHSVSIVRDGKTEREFTYCLVGEVAKSGVSCPIRNKLILNIPDSKFHLLPPISSTSILLLSDMVSLPKRNDISSWSSRGSTVSTCIVVASWIYRAVNAVSLCQVVIVVVVDVQMTAVDLVKWLFWTRFLLFWTIQKCTFLDRSEPDSKKYFRNWQFWTTMETGFFKKFLENVQKSTFLRVDASLWIMMNDWFRTRFSIE